MPKRWETALTFRDFGTSGGWRRFGWAWAAAALFLSIAGVFGMARLFRPVPQSFRVTPSSLSFGRCAQGAANPEPQLVYISGISGTGADFTAWTNDPWLHVNPQKGTSPAMIRISVDASRLPAGRHSGYITISGPHQSSRVPVRLAVDAPAPKVANENAGVSPAALSFGPSQQGGANPAPQWLNITGYGADFTLSASDPWLHMSPQHISPQQGRPPARVSVSVDASRLTAGQYSGYVFITGPHQSSRVQVHVGVNAPYASGQADRRSPPVHATPARLQSPVSFVPPPAPFIKLPAPPAEPDCGPLPDLISPALAELHGDIIWTNPGGHADRVTVCTGRAFPGKIIKGKLPGGVPVTIAPGANYTILQQPSEADHWSRFTFQCTEQNASVTLTWSQKRN